MFRRLFFLLLPLFFITNLYSQDFECTDCHDDVPIKGVHEEILDCADCHSDVVDEEHADSGAKKVQCIDCHDEKSTFRHSSFSVFYCLWTGSHSYS